MDGIVEGKWCFGCGYELSGLASDRCPECGRLNEPRKLLAKYREKQIGLAREFFLYDDRIIVRIKQFLGGETETAVKLAVLDPDIGVVRARNKSFQGGLTLFVVGTLIAMARLYVGYLDRDLANAISLLIFAPAALLGLIITLRACRLVEFYVFRDVRRPEVNLLSVARRGPDVQKFEEFANQIRRGVYNVAKARRA